MKTNHHRNRRSHKMSIPIIWLLGLSEKDKIIAYHILDIFKSAHQKFCTVDFSDSANNGIVNIDFKTENMSEREGQKYYCYVYETLCEMGFVVN